MREIPSVSRRGFLKGAAAVAFPLVVPSSVFGAGAPSNRITVGKIGCGGQGSGLGGAGGQIVAACDPWKSRREKYGPGVRAYRDFRELLASDDIDAVVIATPDHWHVPIGVAAAAAGKDMYIEKPLGWTIEQDKALRAAIKRYGRVFQYGTQQRSSFHCRFGCELVRSGRIGQVKEIIVTAPNSGPGGNTKPMPVPEDLDWDMWLGPAPWSEYTGCAQGGGNWYHCYDYSLGFISGWGAHPLDILVWGYDTHLAGKWRIEGTGVIPAQGRNDAVYDWDVRIEFENGVKMRYTPGGDHTRFIGTEGWIGISRGGISAEPKSLLQSTLGPNDVHLPRSGNHGLNFIECVRTRGTPVSNIDDAVHSDVISHLSDIAIRLRRAIVWDPVTEQIVGDEQARRMMDRATREPWRV